MIRFKVLKLKYIVFSVILAIIIFSLFIFSFAQEESYIELPILMYHSFLKSKSGKYIVNPDIFESDLKYIKGNGYTTITMTDLINYVYDGTSLPEKPIIISFDDGCYNNLTYAVPLLKKYDMKAVISVVGKYTDQYTNMNEANPNYGYLRWEDINSLIEDGTIEFQNHSYDMHKTKNGRKGTLKKTGESLDEYKNILSNDLTKLQEEFREMTGYLPNTFTYPYGSISKESVQIIKDLGFKASLSCISGINKITKKTDCLFNLKRNNRANNVALGTVLNAT